MSVYVYKERPTVLTLVQAQRYDKETYRSGNGFPTIEYVKAVGEVPAHGLIHGTEGDFVVNILDYVSIAPGVEGAYPLYGFTGVYPWYQFEAQYEPE